MIGQLICHFLFVRWVFEGCDRIVKEKERLVIRRNLRLVPRYIMIEIERGTAPKPIRFLFRTDRQFGARIERNTSPGIMTG